MYYGRKKDDLERLGAITTRGITPGYSASGGGGIGPAGTGGGGVAPGEPPPATTGAQPQFGTTPATRTKIEYRPGYGAVARYMPGGIQPRVGAMTVAPTRGVPSGVMYPAGGLFNYYGEDDGLSGFWERIKRAVTPPRAVRRFFTRRVIRPVKQTLRYGGAAIASPFLPASALRQAFRLTPREAIGYEIGAKTTRGVAAAVATVYTGGLLLSAMKPAAAGTSLYAPGGALAVGTGTAAAAPAMAGTTGIAAFPLAGPAAFAPTGVGAAASTGWLAAASKTAGRVATGVTKALPLKEFGAAALMGGFRRGTSFLLQQAGLGPQPESVVGYPLETYEPYASEGGFMGPEAPPPRASARVGITPQTMMLLAAGGGFLYLLFQRGAAPRLGGR